MRKTSNKWSSDKCGRCGESHNDYTGKLDKDNVEYVVCGITNKRMDVPNPSFHLTKMSEIIFEKRVFHIQDNGDTYKVIYIIKHNVERFNYKHIGDIYKWEELNDWSGFSCFEPPVELVERIEKLINIDKDE